MQSFQYIASPLRLFNGADSLGQLGRELDRVNSRRAVIVCGASLARDPVLLDLVTAAMGDRCAGVFSGVRAHSPVPAVQAAAAELRRLGADAVVTIGGGSAVVTARAASILLAENGQPEDLCTRRNERGELRSPKLLAPKLPQLVIPTTPNTATVKAGSAVFDPVEGRRLALFDPKTKAQAVFVHPDLIGSAPPQLVISAAVDTLTLALEGLASLSGNPISDALLIHAIRLLARHLPGLAAGDDPARRGTLVLAALMCGQGTDHTGAGLATVLGHAVGGRFETENGIIKAIVLPHVLRFNAEAEPAGLSKIATSFGLGDAEATPLAAIIDSLQALFGRLGLPGRLRDVRIPRDALADIAVHAMGDWFLRDNPRPVRGSAELATVLDSAW